MAASNPDFDTSIVMSERFREILRKGLGLLLIGERVEAEAVFTSCKPGNPFEELELELAQGEVGRALSDGSRMIRHGRTALELSGRISHAEAAAQARILLGHGYFLLGEYEEAANILAEVELGTGASAVQKIQSACLRAEAAIFRGEREKADFLIQRAIDESSLYERGEIEEKERQGYFEWMGRLEENASRLAWDFGKADRAKHHAMRALEARISLNDPEALANNYCRLAELYFATGNILKAEEFFENSKSLNIGKRTNANTLLLQGKIYLRAGLWEEARTLGEELKGWAVQKRDFRLIVQVNLFLGETYLRWGMDAGRESKTWEPLVEKAEGCYRQADQLSREKSFEGFPEPSFRLAELSIERGEIGQARTFLSEGKRRMGGTPGVALQGVSRRVAGQIHVAGNEPAEGIMNLRKALSIFSTMGFVYEAALCHEWIGKAQIRSDREVWGRGLEALETAAEMYGRIKAESEKRRVKKEREGLEKRLQEGFEIEVSTAESKAGLAQVDLEPFIEKLVERADTRDLLLKEFTEAISRVNGIGAVVLTGAHPDIEIIAAAGFSEKELKDVLGDFRRFQLSGTDTKFERFHFEELNAESEDVNYWVCCQSAPEDRGKFQILKSLTRMGLEQIHLRIRVEEEVSRRKTAEPTATRSLMDLGFVGVSDVMKKVEADILRIASSKNVVLITGESGTGKEVVAKAIHKSSKRANGPFLTLNCGSMPGQLMESLLFGHRKGAFTGADKDSPGIVRQAQGGTLFLDEIGELPLELQPKLLRLLQEDEIQPLGAEGQVKVDVRIIAATNRDLLEEMEAKKFREDLYYRLDVIKIKLPPLRDRAEDIPHLIHHFLEIENRESMKRTKISEAALNDLISRDWPGNIRELQNAIKRAIAFAKIEDLLMPEDFPLQREAAVPANFDENTILIGFDGKTLEDAIGELRAKMINYTFQLTGRNLTETARQLNLDRNTLVKYMDQLGIERPERRVMKKSITRK